MLSLNKEWKTKLGIFRNDRRAYYSFLLLAFLYYMTRTKRCLYENQKQIFFLGRLVIQDFFGEYKYLHSYFQFFD